MDQWPDQQVPPPQPPYPPAASAPYAPTYTPAPYAPPPYAGSAYPHGYPGPPPRWLPSRLTTVLVTAFFGLFGLIPAWDHTRRARELGMPTTRYWTAFGITLATAVVAWLVAVTVVLGAVGAVDSTAASESQSPAQAGPAGPVAEPVAHEPYLVASVEVGGAWTVHDLLPTLLAFADDDAYRTEEFTSGYGVMVPCGASGEQSLAPDAVDFTMGGAGYQASVQILPDEAAAQRELDRQAALLSGCTGEFPLRDLAGAIWATCGAGGLETAGVSLVYVEACDHLDGRAFTFAFAVMRSDNAVLTFSTPSLPELESLLPSLETLVRAE